MKKLPIILALLITTTAYGAEADHYYQREDPLEDISEQVNKRANRYLKQGVEEANRTKSCDSKNSELILYKSLQNYFANHQTGQLVIDILETDEFTKRVIPVKDSVFKYWKLSNGALLAWNSSKEDSIALSPMVQMANQLIGVDKFEHMFGMGFRYFKGHYLNKSDLIDVLTKGILKEKYLLGGNILETGVFAYGDLSANFNGMRFWNHILQNRDDVLGKNMNIGPYVICNEGKWETVKNNPIDFTNYMDASMDESINCSMLASKPGVERYKLGMTELSPEYRCPMSMKKHLEIRKKYEVVIKNDRKNRTIADWLFNTKIRRVGLLYKQF